jgi:myb proto-oncogene protein
VWYSVDGRRVSRSRDALDPSVDRPSGRSGPWTEDADVKLKDAVQMYGGKDWVAIAALVPGRMKRQCCNRWEKALNPSIDRTAGCTGTGNDDDIYYTRIR